MKKFISLLSMAAVTFILTLSVSANPTDILLAPPVAAETEDSNMQEEGIIQPLNSDDEDDNELEIPLQ